MTTPSVDGLSGARADAPADALTGELIAAENAHVAHNYHPLPVVVTRGAPSLAAMISPSTKAVSPWR